MVSVRNIQINWGIRQKNARKLRNTPTSWDFILHEVRLFHFIMLMMNTTTISIMVKIKPLNFKNNMEIMKMGDLNLFMQGGITKEQINGHSKDQSTTISLTNFNGHVGYCESGMGVYTFNFLSDVSLVASTFQFIVKMTPPWASCSDSI